MKDLRDVRICFDGTKKATVIPNFRGDGQSWPMSGEHKQIRGSSNFMQNAYRAVKMLKSKENLSS